MRKIKMTKTLARKLGVINTWDALRKFGDQGKDVAVTYHTAGIGPASSHRTVVFSPTHQTNPKAPWYDNGHKTFVGMRPESFEPALAWATEQYKITEWAKDPTARFSLIPKYVLDRMIEAAKQLSDDRPEETQ